MTNAVRFRIIDVECDSADPQVMAALRDLLEQYKPRSVTGALAPVSAGFEQPAAPTPAALPKRTPQPAPEPPPVAPEPPPAPLRVKVPLHEKPPTANPTGRVEGFVAQAGEQAALVERIMKAVDAKPGVTVQALATLLLGSPNPRSVRRIDMLVGPLVMSGKLARTDGRLFATAALAAAAPMLTRRAPGRAAPLSDIDRTKKAFDRIVERFGQDSTYPLDKLAQELFGDSARLSLNKVQVMLSRLVSTERLERVGATEWCPVGDKKLGRGREDEDASEDETDLESNGQPDEDDDGEELDLS